MDPWVGNAFLTAGSGITLTQPDTVTGGTTIAASATGNVTSTSGGADTRIAVWTSATVLTGYTDFTWDDAHEGLVIGSGNLTSGINAQTFIIGPSNNLATAGVQTVVIGDRNVTDGGSVWIVGSNNDLTGAGSGGAFGAGNTVSVGDAYAFGEGNIVSGGDSHAWGEDNTVSGSDSRAVGELNIVTGSDASAFGESNQVSGDGACAVGSGNLSSGDGSFLFGDTLVDAGFTAFMLGGNITADRNGVHVGIVHTGLICTSSMTSVPTGQLFQVVDAATGTFTTVDLKTVSVVKGIIMSIST